MFYAEESLLDRLARRAVGLVQIIRKYQHSVTIPVDEASALFHGLFLVIANLEGAEPLFISRAAGTMTPGVLVHYNFRDADSEESETVPIGFLHELGRRSRLLHLLNFGNRNGLSRYSLIQHLGRIADVPTVVNRNTVSLEEVEDHGPVYSYPADDDRQIQRPILQSTQQPMDILDALVGHARYAYKGKLPLRYLFNPYFRLYRISEIDYLIAGSFPGKLDQILPTVLNGGSNDAYDDPYTRFAVRFRKKIEAIACRNQKRIEIANRNAPTLAGSFRHSESIVGLRMV